MRHLPRIIVIGGRVYERFVGRAAQAGRAAAPGPVRGRWLSR
jgi:hypothetical protein